MAGKLLRTLGTAARHSTTKFAVVGALGFGTDLGLLYVLHGVLGMWLPLATTIAYVVAFALSFVLSREWVFPNGGDMRRQVIRYAVLVTGILVLTVAGVQTLAWLAVSYLIAKVLTSGLVGLVNYAASRWWVFRVSPAPD